MIHLLAFLQDHMIHIIGVMIVCLALLMLPRVK